MEIEPVDVAGLRGRDFVIYGDFEEPKFEARLLDGSKSLRVLWTDPWPWTLRRLREVQRLAGGPGVFDRIDGFATDRFADAINAGIVDELQIQSRLTRALGEKWSVTINKLKSNRINISANRAGG